MDSSDDGEPGRARIVVDPQVRFGRPGIGETGPTLSDVVGRVWAGEDAEVVAEDYDLSRGQVLVACWFVAAYGVEDVAAQLDGRFKRWGGKLGRAWEAWADGNTERFGRGAYDEIPDPPGKV